MFYQTSEFFMKKSLLGRQIMLPGKQKINFNNEDYYRVLGVEKEATLKQIRVAYLNLSVKYHPDKNKDPDAIAMFIKVQRAYNTLNDPISRAQYDRELQSFSEKTATLLLTYFSFSELRNNLWLVLLSQIVCFSYATSVELVSESKYFKDSFVPAGFNFIVAALGVFPSATQFSPDSDSSDSEDDDVTINEIPGMDL